MASYTPLTPTVVDIKTANGEEKHEIAENSPIQQGDPISPEIKEGDVGLAFSGGGIRSAALCSGVMRRMLQKNVPDKVKSMYLSCVSGGGYTGTAYLDWKLRMVDDDKDDGQWHDIFFDHMRSNSGYMCNWQKPLHGIWDSICFLGMILVVIFIMPSIIWFPYAFPLAYVIDFLFGEILRAPSVCEAKTKFNVTIISNVTEPELLRSLRRKCEPPIERVLLFVIPFIVGLIFFCLSRFVTRFFFATRLVRLRGTFRFIATVAGLVFFMTVLPWFINDFISRTRLWVQVMIVVVSPIFWFFFPIVRNYASLCLIIYIYAFVTSYRVYQESKLGVEYSKRGFNIALYVSAVLLWFFPITGAFHQGIVHAFNRWRLNRAFYHEHDARTIQCLDIFPGLKKYEKAGFGFGRSPSINRRIFKGRTAPHKIVKLGNLFNKGITPKFICNVTVNDWQLDEQSRRCPNYTLLTMTPSRIELIDQQFFKKSYEMEGNQDGCRVIDCQPLSLTVNPNQISLAQSMATSAAAVALDMGSYDNSIRTVGDLMAMLGLDMGDSVVSDLRKQEGRNRCWKFVIPLLAELGQGIPLVSLPIVYFTGGDEWWLATGVLCYFILIAILALIAVQPTGSQNPGRMEKLTRWCVVHVFFVRFLRNLMNVVNKGLRAPALLRLSDGGHFENLALLPLLKLKLKRIVVVNGGNTPEEDYGEPLLYALNLAREKLHCSFTGMDGRDISEDLRARFLDPPDAPRSYKFKVQYYSTNSEGVEVKDGEGEIIFIAPRKPSSKQPSAHAKTWADVEQGQLKEEIWGPGPELVTDEVDHLTWCCAECCHSESKMCQWLSNKLCGAFPQHTTANQFFTPSLFTAYHREGYYACYVAKAAEFLLTAANESKS